MLDEKMEEIKGLAEKYLGAAISEELFIAEAETVANKHAWIISREGDADGERTKPYYVAQLFAEAIRSDILTVQCMRDYEDKKRAARKADNPNSQPHYSTKNAALSRATAN